jgi:hypothetical protein
MLYALPGAGADRRMYSGAWNDLANCVFIDWPVYEGEASISAFAHRLVRVEGIRDGDSLLGSSLGGIIACEVAKIRKIQNLVLIGSAIRKGEINSILSILHPIINLAPIEFVQRAIGKLPSDVTQMFSEGQAPFIRAMCNAIFDWAGLDESVAKPLRIHGRYDRVIPLPDDIDLVLDGGHLLAMTHPRECSSFVSAKLFLDPTVDSDRHRV